MSHASSRRGLLPRRRYRLLLLAAAILSPLLYFPRVIPRLTTTVPCGRPAPNCGLGDPVIAATVMGRAVKRFEAGLPFNVDERVFAPYPNTWPLSDGHPIQAAIGWPVYRATGSWAAAYDVPYLLGCALAVWGAGLLFARIAAPGWGALFAALLYAWCPGRLNNFGVLATMWAGLVPLGIHFALGFVRRGRARDAVAWAATWIALGLGALYGLFLGSLFLGMVLCATALGRARRRRLTLFAAAALPTAAFLAWAYRPSFHMAEEFDAHASLAMIEVQAADLLAVFHEGVFSGPLRTLLDALVPGFPEGASALFPTVTFLLALAAAAGARRGRVSARPERRPLRWIALAVLCFLFALGPTVRLAGRPLFPGPWRLVAHLPVFDTLRGVYRWDQWYGLALAAAAALLLTRAFRTPRRWPLAVAPLVLALDLWPRPDPALPLPAPSPFDDVLRALPADAVVGDFPFTPDTSIRSWAEQLSHGRRVLVGLQSYPPPIHYWLERRTRGRPVEEAIAIYRELGIRAFQARLAELPPRDAALLRELAREPARVGAERGLVREGTVLLLFPPRAPLLVDPRTLRGLVFRGGAATVPGLPGRLSFRLSRERTPVRFRAPDGATTGGAIHLPVVGLGGLPVRLEGAPPPGSVVLDARGREVGRVQESR